MSCFFPASTDESYPALFLRRPLNLHYITLLQNEGFKISQTLETSTDPSSSLLAGGVTWQSTEKSKAIKRCFFALLARIHVSKVFLCCVLFSLRAFALQVFPLSPELGLFPLILIPWIKRHSKGNSQVKKMVRKNPTSTYDKKNSMLNT